MDKVDRPIYAYSAANYVMGFYPSEKTMRTWMKTGFGGLTLESYGGMLTTPRCIINFIYKVNRRRPPQEAFQFVVEHLPRPLKIVAREVFGAEMDRSTLLRWRTRGVNGIKLRVLSVGKYRLVTSHEFRDFLEKSGARKFTDTCESEMSVQVATNTADQVTFDMELSEQNTNVPTGQTTPCGDDAECSYSALNAATCNASIVHPEVAKE